MCPRTDLWEPWAGNRPGPPGRMTRIVPMQVIRVINKPPRRKTLAWLRRQHDAEARATASERAKGGQE